MNGASGSEQSGIRPVVIIQNDKGNYYSDTTIVAMVTSKQKKTTAVHVTLHSKDIFSKKSYVLTEQLRTISISRLGKYIGLLSGSDMRKIDKALKKSLGLIE
jgi:mRNA interferase MazF